MGNIDDVTALSNTNASTMNPEAKLYNQQARIGVCIDVEMQEYWYGFGGLRVFAFSGKIQLESFSTIQM